MLVGFLIFLGTINFPQQPDIGLEEIVSPGYRGRVVWLSPHENENVVNDYLKEQIKKRGGRYLILRQNGERHIKLRFDDRAYEVDPNRIFTPAGARSSLTRLNDSLSEGDPALEEAVERAVALGRFIIERMGNPGRRHVIIAVHNNTDGYDNDGKNGVGTVSIERYRKRFEAGAGYILDINTGMGDEDDLFFITDRRDFRRMKKAAWPIVLQHPRVATDPNQDDGSLSVYAEMIGARYINVEAQREDDHLQIQKYMVDFVFNLRGIRGR
jgi:hypothetical protein